MSGATELRDGNFGTAGTGHVNVAAHSADAGPDLRQPCNSVNGPRSWDLDIALDFTFADPEANYRLTLRNGVLVYREILADPVTATVTVKLDSKFRLLLVAFGDFTSPGLDVSGDQSALQSLLGALDSPDPNFNIVTP